MFTHPNLDKLTSSAGQLGLDRAVEALRAGKDEWARLPLAHKIDRLLQARQNLGRLAQRWVARRGTGRARAGSRTI